MSETTALTVAEERPMQVQQGIDIGGGVVVTIDTAMRIAERMAGATTLPEHYREPSDLMAAVLTSAQLRMPLMTVINGTHMIKGKVTLSADLMAGIVSSSGLLDSWDEGETETGYYVTGTRRGRGSLTVEFTDADAKAAGLTGDNWRKFRTDMLRARAMSRLCRRLFPDILAGLYSDEEMGADLQPAQPTDQRQPRDADDEIEGEFVETPEKSDADTIRRLTGRLNHAYLVYDIDVLKAEAAAAVRDGLIRRDGEGEGAIRKCIRAARARAKLVTELTELLEGATTSEELQAIRARAEAAEQEGALRDEALEAVQERYQEACERVMAAAPADEDDLAAEASPTELEG